jgi:hypothetical protein
MRVLRFRKKRSILRWGLHPTLRIGDPRRKAACSGTLQPPCPHSRAGGPVQTDVLEKSASSGSPARGRKPAGGPAIEFPGINRAWPLLHFEPMVCMRSVQTREADHITTQRERDVINRTTSRVVHLEHVRNKLHTLPGYSLSQVFLIPRKSRFFHSSFHSW